MGGEATAQREERTLSGVFGDKAIRLTTMDPGLRRLVLAGIAGVVCAGILVAARDVPAPRVLVLGSPVSVPDLVGCLVLQLVAMGLLVTGAMHAHWSLRAVLLLVWTAVMLGPVVLWWLTIGPATVLVTLTITVMSLGLVGAVWLWAAGITGLERLGVARTERAHRRRLRPVTLAVCLACTAALYCVTAAPYVASTTLARLVPDVIALLVLVLGSLVDVYMVPIVFLTASDFAEWADAIASRAVRLAGPARGGVPVLPVVAVCASLGVFADALRIGDGVGEVLGGVLAMAVLIAVALGLALVLRPAPRDELSLGALVAAGLVWLVSAYLVWTEVPPLQRFIYSPWLWAGELPIPILLCVLARRFRRIAPAAFLLAVLTCVNLLQNLHGPHGITADLGAGSSPIFLGDGYRTFPAMACLGLVAWYTATRTWSAERRRRLGLVLGLLLAMQGIDWLGDAFTLAARHGESISLVQGLLLIAAMLWDVWMSGSTVTNRNGLRVPRHARVVVYVGYTLLSVSTVALFALFPDFWGGQPPDYWAALGIGTLGGGVIVALFTFRLLRRPSPAPSSAATVQGSGSPDEA